MTAIALQGQKALVLFDEWVMGPDGRSYKGAWGRCFYHVAKELFGFDPKVGANYFLQIGEGQGSILAAGCKLHFSFFVDGPPPNTDIYVPPSEQLA